MTETLQRPVVASRERYPLAADAFLYAALIILVGMGVQMGIAYLMSGGELDTWVVPTWLQLIGVLAMPLGVIGGPLLAWRVYGRHIGWRDLLSDVVGNALGGALLGIAFMVLFVLMRVLPSPFPEDEGPWELVIVATLAVVAFLAKPVIAAVRDLVGAKEHPRRHGLRLATTAILLAVVIVSVFVGGESAELGIFLAMPAAAAACAAVAMDWWRAQQHETISSK